MQFISSRMVSDSKDALLMSGVGGFPVSDRDLFCCGYAELCRLDLSGCHAVEICCGAGRLAAALAGVFPDARITGIDLYAAHGPEVDDNLRKNPNLNYVSGDAFDLSRFADNSIDLIWGQAALHHLAHNLTGLRDECARVLKPGGRLVFIFEPLGHNPLVAAVRAIRMARHELPDESNLYFSQLERLGGAFSKSEVQVFNLLGYFMKGMPKPMYPLVDAVKSIDRHLFQKIPKLTRYAANFNVVFTK